MSTLYRPRGVRAVEAPVTNPARLQDANPRQGFAVVGTRVAHQEATHPAVVLVPRSLSLAEERAGTETVTPQRVYRYFNPEIIDGPIGSTKRACKEIWHIISVKALLGFVIIRTVTKATISRARDMPPHTNCPPEIGKRDCACRFSRHSSPGDTRNICKRFSNPHYWRRK